MAREHSKIKMTPEELSEYLGLFNRLIVATLDDDGAPWADAAAYVFMNDRVYFRVPTDTATYAHLRRDGLVCCVVESKPDGSPYYGIKGAMLHGGAEALDEARAPEIHRALAAVADPVTPGRRDGAVFSVGLDDSTSFSFDKIQGRYQDKPLQKLQEEAARG
jgi:Pyridoxamine 5'-phosphate oxidase